MDTSVNQSQNEPESTADEAEDTGDKRERTSKKQFRGSKQIYVKVMAQMEFYFSASNLSKDRFMSELIKEDPCKLSHLEPFLLMILNFPIFQMFHSQHL